MIGSTKTTVNGDEPEIEIGLAYAKGNQIIIVGTPFEIPDLPDDHIKQHNCDWMKCPSFEHVLIRLYLPDPYDGQDLSKFLYEPGGNGKHER